MARGLPGLAESASRCRRFALDRRARISVPPSQTARRRSRATARRPSGRKCGACARPEHDRWRRRRRRDRARTSPSGATASKPTGNSSAMKPSKARRRASADAAISAARNGMLWRMPSMVERIERGGLRVDRLARGRRVGDELGDHRIVIDRDLAALVDAGVVAHGDAVARCLRPAAGSASAARSRAGNCDTGSSA